MATAHVLVSGHHASCHQASEFLQDRHPNPSTSFALQIDEIAVAYGPRAVVKLVEVLSLPDLPTSSVAKSLRVLLSLLSSQETKTKAVKAKVVPCVAHFLAAADAETRQLACQVLASLSQLFQGRLDILQTDALSAIVRVLDSTPAEGAQCLEAFSVSIDGCAALLACPADASAALVHTLQQSVPGPDGNAAFAALQCLANLNRTQKGVAAALEAQLPSAIVAHLTQALQVRIYPGQDAWRQQLCTAAAACLSHMCQHTEARPAVQAASGIPLLARLCDVEQLPIEAVRYASAALSSIAVSPDFKVETFEAAGSALMPLLKCSDPAAASNAKMAIRNTSNHPKSRVALQKVLKEEADEYLRGLPDLPPDYRYHVPKHAMMYNPNKTAVS